jgi:hypothetical protein
MSAPATQVPAQLLTRVQALLQQAAVSANWRAFHVDIPGDFANYVAAAQAEPFSLAGLECFKEDPPGAGEDGLAGVGGHDGRLSVSALHAQGRQPVQFALPLVGREPQHVVLPEQGRIMPAAWSVDLQVGAQAVLTAGSAPRGDAG